MNFLIFGWAANKIGHTVEEILRSLMLMLCSLFYELVIFFYDIFIRLGTAEILTSSQIQKIYSRVTLILGIFMLFKLIFSFIQYLLDPDKMSDKSKGAGKIIFKAVIVVALLGTCPFIFQQAYKLQSEILESNILGKVILGVDDANSDVSNFGADLSSYMFFSFYSFYEGETCEFDIEDMQDEVRNEHSFSRAKACVNEEPTNSNHDWVINFAGNGVLSLVVSVVVLYIILSYCLSVGMRVIQLAFLQLIAPIPILSYMGEDKDGAFSKWVKRCVSTFIDLFIRMAIIYFVVYIIDLIMNSNSDSYYLLLSTTGDPTGKTKFWLIVIVILGLLMFAKKAPELLKEVLPQGMGGNDYGFSLGKRFDNMVGGKQLRKLPKTATRAIGLGAGAVTGATVSGISRYNAQKELNFDKNNKEWQDGGRKKAILGMLGGVGAGMFYGARSGMKKGNVLKNVSGVVDERRKADNEYVSLINAGGSVIGRGVSRFADTFSQSRGQIDKKKLENANLVKQSVDAIEKLVESSSVYKRMELQKAQLQQMDGETPEQFERRLQMFTDRQDAYKEAFINAALQGKTQFSYSYSDIEKVTEKVKVGTKMVESETEFEEVIEERQVQIENMVDKFGKPLMKPEKVTVKKPKMVEQDIFEERVVFKEVLHTDMPVTMSTGDSTKASQVVTEVGNVENNIETRNITLVDANGVEKLAVVPKNGKGILDLTKDVRRTEASIKGAEGYMAGQANLSDKNKSS